VTLFDPELCVPDLVIMGSHCIGLEIIIDALAEAGIAVRVSRSAALVDSRPPDGTSATLSRSA
jgi:hypothetical protein